MSNRSFIQRSLINAAGILKDSLFSQEYAAGNRLLQLLDPRIKMLTFILFIFLVLLAKNIISILSLYIFCLLLARVSGIGMGFFLRRTWLFIPLFSLFIVLPALFGQFSPGEALFTFSFLGVALAITRQGLGTAILFVLRVATSVSFVVLLSLTTKQAALLKVLRIFKVPHIFVITLGICYRYIFLFILVIENTYLAIKSRIGLAVDYKKGQHIVAWNMASLWQRSYKLNEDVYSAMLSRGYCGEPVLLYDFRLKFLDWLWLCFSLLLFIALAAKQFPS
ncbi:MAG: cobalt ECF transporter T component CbiQ [Candidatus Omnitrophota bacterium]|jgi:cobalt/nickel transport system permease protein